MYFIDNLLVNHHRSYNDINNHNRRLIGFDVPSYEVETLRDLYNSAQGSQWSWKLPEFQYGAIWNFEQINPNPCSEKWQGVTCSSSCVSSPCSIMDLVLEDYGLNGTLPMSIGNLTVLTNLQISSNPFLSGESMKGFMFN
jgi:hypothetical protein